MKKVQKIYRENRVLLILLIIVIVCVIAMGVALFKYFYTGNNDKWGDRLDGIENVPLEESRLSDLTLSLKSDNSELISEAKCLVTGFRVDFIIYFQPAATLTDAQGIASKILDNFSEEEKKYYDFSFALIQNKSEQSEGFTIEGTKTATRTQNDNKIVWNNNNTPTTEEPSESE